MDPPWMGLFSIPGILSPSHKMGLFSIPRIPPPSLHSKDPFSKEGWDFSPVQGSKRPRHDTL